MNHDPLCPQTTGIQLSKGFQFCVCDLIARVREDERMSFDRSKEYLAYEMALRDAAAAARQINSPNAAAAIEALGGKR